MVDKICKIIFTLDSLANLFTVIGLPLTAYAVYYTKNAFKKQNEALELQKKDSDEQKILGAWSLLAHKGTGDLGRKDALEFLHSRGKSLVGVDLTGAYLFDLNLKKILSCKADLMLANFEGAVLYRANFTGAFLWYANFTNAKLSSSHFEGASLFRVRFINVELYGVNFTKTEHFERAIFENCYVFGDPKMYTEGNLPTTPEDDLPTAPEGYEFVVETNEDKTPRTKIVGGLRRYYIKRIKTETKKP